MANAMFNNFLEGLLTGTYDMSTNPIKCDLYDTGTDTFAPTTDTFYSTAVTTTALPQTTAGTATLGTKTTTGGEFGSANPTMSAVDDTAGGGRNFENLFLWYDTTVSSTSPIVAVYDTFTSGMPVTPNGGDINITVNASGWFSL